LLRPRATLASPLPAIAISLEPSLVFTVAQSETKANASQKAKYAKNWRLETPKTAFYKAFCHILIIIVGD
jgi:hypothetical protein